MGRLPIALFVGALLLNLLGASYVTTEGDASGEVRKLLGLQHETRPQHLVQTAVFRAAWRAADAVGLGEPAFVAPQTLNALLGAATAVLVLALLRRQGAGIGAGTAVFLAAFWALSRAPWVHARTAETGITSMPLLLGAFVAVWPPMRAGAVRTGAAAALLAGSVLLSLANVLLVPAFLLAVALSAGARRGRSLAAAVVVLAIVGAAPFVAVAAGDGVRSAGGFLAWLGGHPDAAGLDRTPGLFTLLRAATGVARLVFPESGGETAVKAALTGAAVEVRAGDWLTLARNLAWLAALAGGAAIGAWRTRRDREMHLLLVAILPTAVFNLVWLGSDPQFWLPVYAFLLALVVRVLPPRRAARRDRVCTASAGAALVLLYVANVPAGPPTPLHPGGDGRWRAAKRLQAELPAHALVLIPMPSRTPFELVPRLRPDVDVLDLSYTAPRELRGEDFVRWLDDRIARKKAGVRRVYAEGLETPLPVRLLGSWGFVANARGVTREELREHWKERWGLTIQDAPAGLMELDWGVERSFLIE